MRRSIRLRSNQQNKKVTGEHLSTLSEEGNDDWDAHILENLKYQRDLGLSQPDKERWDKAREEMISLRRTYNEGRTGRQEVPPISVEESVRTLNEVEDHPMTSQKRKSSEPSTSKEGHVKSKKPALVGPTENHRSGDHESPSTSKKCRDEAQNESEDGDNPLPNLPQFYINRRIQMKGRKSLTEEEFLSIISRNVTKPRSVIAITGPKGIGKTTFFAQIGSRIRRTFPERKLFYMKMGKVVEAVKERNLVDEDNAIWAALQSLTKEDYPEAIPNRNGNGRMPRVELFIDGFDDIEWQDWGLVCGILTDISDFESTLIRLWLPCDFREVQGLLPNVESYSLQPLDYSSQVELITKYLESHSHDRKTLQEFVENCVKDALNSHVELGSPLQCLLVGAACLSESNLGFRKLLKPENILDISNEYEDILLDAARSRSFPTFKLIADLDKVDINSKDKNGNSPLFLSLYAKGNVDCLEKLKFLVEKGADLDHLNKRGDNLLLHGAKYGSVECVEFIINLRKFEINCVDSCGNTPLFLCADSLDGLNVDCLPKLKLLIELANLNDLKSDKHNLLLYSAQFASAEVLEYILSLNKFDVNGEDDDGDSPLLLSVFQYQGIDCLKKLEMVKGRGGKLDHVNKEGKNLLHLAAQYGSLDVLKYVINLGRFDINSKDKFGKSALHHARIKGKKKGVINVDIKAKVKLLIEKSKI